MAKLIPTVALISSLLVIIATATSAYRTTITTVEIDDPDLRQGSQGSQECRREVQGRDLSSCAQYLKPSGSRRPPELEEGRVLKMPVEDNHFQEDNQAGWQQLQRCCSQINQVKDECQCDALKQLIQQVSGGRQTKEYQTVMQKAGSIPSACGFSQPCPFPRVLF